MQSEIITGEIAVQSMTILVSEFGEYQMETAAKVAH